jgi:hypothetical protein
VLASVFDRVEEVGEVPRCVGCTDLCHSLRLSDIGLAAYRARKNPASRWTEVPQNGASSKSRFGDG